MPFSKRSVFVGIVVVAIFVWWIAGRGPDDPEHEIRKRMDASISWFEEGAGLSGIPAGLHARKVADHFTAAVEISVPGWTGQRAGRQSLLQLSATTFQSLDSARLGTDFEVVRIDPEAGIAEGLLKVRANLRARDGARGQHAVDLRIFFRMEEGDWKIDRVVGVR